jgi:hypothetical protein
VACRLYYIFSNCLINDRIFLTKRVFEYKMRVLLSLKIFSETFLILRRTKGNIIVNIIRYSRNASVIFVSFEGNLKYSRSVLENIEIKN